MLEEKEQSGSPTTTPKKEDVLDVDVDEFQGEPSMTGSPGKLGYVPKHAPKTISPYHALLLSALQSSELLTPIHAEVRNHSYWYESRRKLGPKRQATLITKLNENSFRWESYIYKMKPRDEDFEVVPTKTFLNTHKTKWAAFKNCEKECKARDSNPGENSDVDPSAIMSTHFHLLIVSTKFDRKSPLERNEMVYEALLAGAGQPLRATDVTEADAETLDTNTIIKDAYKNQEKLRPWQLSDVNYNRYSKLGPRANNGGLGNCVPDNLKGVSVYGKNVCNLEVFRVLLTPDGPPIKLIIEAKTPSQWRPEEFIAPISERLGDTHMESSASHVPKNLQTAKQNARLKQLTTVVKDNLRNTVDTSSVSSKSSMSKSGKDGAMMSKSVNSLAEALGLDSSISGLDFGKKVGGIYGHFFSDVPVTIKDMIVKKYKENKTLIQMEGNKNYAEEAKKGKKKKKKEDSFKPVTGMSKLRDKMLSTIGQADPDVGTQTEAEMMEEVYIGARKMERAAIRLQRMRRANVLHRAVKRIWKRKYAVWQIQRVFRGGIGRMYVQLFKNLVPIAVVRVQRLFRTRKTKRIILKFQKLTFRMTRWVLPKIKRFLRNCFLKNIEKFYSKAVVIQSVLRMYLVKNRYAKKLSERNLIPWEWRPFYTSQVIKIQRILRGNWGRARFLTFIEDALILRVDVPHSIKIQRRFRGVLGRKISAKRRYELKCLLLLQRVCKAFVRKIWEAQMVKAKLEIDSAVQIQRIARGRIDRTLFGYLIVEHRYKNIFIPAVIFTQSQIRGWIARKKVRRIMLEIVSANKCQNAWRCLLARREMMVKWRQAREKYIFDIAAKIQKIIRGFLSKVKYPTSLTIYKARILYAAKVIMRAWCTYKYSKRMQFLLDDNRQNFYKAKLPRFAAARAEIFEDQDEIQGDIKNAQKIISRLQRRLKELDNFQVEAELRHVQIDRELNGLSPEDFERGWADAFGEEFEVLSRQMQMAKEEQRLLRSRTLITTKELTVLYVMRIDCSCLEDS